MQSNIYGGIHPTYEMPTKPQIDGPQKLGKKESLVINLPKLSRKNWGKNSKIIDVGQSQ